MKIFSHILLCLALLAGCADIREPQLGEETPSASTFALIPGAPTGITANPGNEQVELSWTEPSNTGGAPITDYTIQYSSNSGSSWSDFTDEVSPQTSATVTGLANGTPYVFQVAAVNAAGAGSFAPTEVTITPRTVPSSPTEITVVPENSQASLYWLAPSSDGGSAIIDYVIEYSSNSGESWIALNDGVSTATTATVTGLTNGLEYVFRVMAVNVAGSGSPSTLSLQMATLTVPGTPTSLIAVAENGQVALSWTAPADDGGSAITDYVIQFLAGESSSWATYNDGTSTSTSATVTDLANGTAYTFRVAAVNALGQGANSTASQSVTPSTAPGIPSGVTGAPGNTEILVSWTAPSNDGGNALTDYIVQMSSDSGAHWTTLDDGVSVSESLNVTGLTNGTAYVFQVAAVNATGTGSFSASSLSVTPRTAPGVPTSVTGTEGDSQVSLSWTAPSSNGGSAINDYLIEFSSDGGTSWSVFNDGTSSVTSASVTGLTNGTAYVFKVAAANAAGAGDFSIVSASVTPRTNPGAPTGISGIAGNSQVSLNWIVPADNGGSAITDYVIQYSSNSGNSWSTFDDGTSTSPSATVTGLTNGTPYVFQVAAVNASGTGSYSSNSNFITPYTLPGAPTEVSGTAGDSQVALSWTAPASDGGNAITDYLIEYSTDSGSSWTTVNDGTHTSNTATVTGLTNGTSYLFRVAAVNAAGAGDYSIVSSGVTPKTITNAPTGVSGTPDDSQVLLSWTAPSDDGGSPITDYVIEYSSNGGSSWLTFNDGTSTSASTSVTGLTNGTAYVFKVAAVNGSGTGSFSGNSESVTPRTTPEAPTSVMGTAGNTQVALSWTAPASNGGALITDYTIQYSSNDGANWIDFTDGVSPSTSAVVTDLANGTAYLFRVAAVNVAGTGSTSESSLGIIPKTTADKPTGVSGTPGDSQVSLSWNAPASDGGSELTDYVIQYSSNSGTSWSTFNDGASTSTSVVVTGLTNGIAYIFKVAAVNTAGTGAYSDNSQSVTPYKKPDSPSDLAGTSGDGQVSLAWRAPASDGGNAINDYVIEYSTDGTTWTTANDGTYTSTIATVTGLANGTAYLFRVAAVNAAGTGSYSSNSEAVTPYTLSDAPSGVSGTAGDSQVSLSWTAPSEDGGNSITDYVIQYSSNSGTSWSTFNDGTFTSTSATVTGLTNGTAYVFKVAAVNAAGTGRYSSSSLILTPRTVPDAPTGVSGNPGDAQVALNWTASVSNGGSPITDYTVQYSSDGGTNWTVSDEGVSSSPSALITGLTNGTAYIFKVAAVNEAGTGTYSSNSSAVVPFTSPDAPSGVSGVPGNTQVSLSWNAPASDGGSAITDYVIEYSSNNGTSWTTFSDGTSTSTSSVVSGLTNGTAYIFRVAAVNAAGPQGYSPSSLSIIPFTIPGAPTGATGTPGNTQVSLSWTAPSSNGGSAITDYVIQYSSNSGTSWSTFSDGTSTSTSATVTGLTNGTAYIFQVAAVNAAGTGSYSTGSASVTPYTNPGAPTGVIGTAGNTQVSLSWTAPSSNGGSAINDFVIQYSSNSGTSWTTFSDGTSTATSAIVTGLTNGTAYIFQVAAVNAAGTGSYSSSSASVTPYTTPGAPTGVGGAAGNTQVSLEWTAPSSNGGALITDYSIQYSSNNGITWIDFSDGVNTSTSAIVTGLANGTSCLFRVAAVNLAGIGSYTQTAVGITPLTTPGAPTGVTGTAGNTQVSLSWTAPSNDGGSAITDYVIQYSSNSGTSWTTFSDGTSTSTSATVTGLTNGTAYIFEVAAVNAAGQGSYSESSTSVTPYATPGAPTGVTGTAGNT
ncbi:MAG: fibronectin type III domain-containing protein, partial [Proteobacteria bacterium]|nr:fibronectin type III domain-containing protein [Pseudomonadota bacterium]